MRFTLRVTPQPGPTHPHTHTPTHNLNNANTAHEPKLMSSIPSKGCLSWVTMSSAECTNSELIYPPGTGVERELSIVRGKAAPTWWVPAVPYHRSSRSASCTFTATSDSCHPASFSGQVRRYAIKGAQERRIHVI